MLSEKVGAFRADRTEKVSAYRAKNLKKGALAGHIPVLPYYGRTSPPPKYRYANNIQVRPIYGTHTYIYACHICELDVSGIFLSKRTLVCKGGLVCCVAEEVWCVLKWCNFRAFKGVFFKWLGVFLKWFGVINDKIFIMHRYNLVCDIMNEF